MFLVYNYSVLRLILADSIHARTPKEILSATFPCQGSSTGKENLWGPEYTRTHTHTLNVP